MIPAREPNILINDMVISLPNAQAHRISENGAQFALAKCVTVWLSPVKLIVIHFYYLFLSICFLFLIRDHLFFARHPVRDLQTLNQRYFLFCTLVYVLQ